MAYQEGASVTLREASRIYLEEGFCILPQYLKHVKQYFRAEPVSLPFKRKPEKSIQKINDWVSAQTNDTIKQLGQDIVFGTVDIFVIS